MYLFHLSAFACFAKIVEYIYKGMIWVSWCVTSLCRKFCSKVVTRIPFLAGTSELHISCLVNDLKYMFLYFLETVTLPTYYSSSRILYESCGESYCFPMFLVQFLLVDLRCHGDSASMKKCGPHTVSSTALDVLKLVSISQVDSIDILSHSGFSLLVYLKLILLICYHIPVSPFCHLFYFIDMY